MFYTCFSLVLPVFFLNKLIFLSMLFLMVIGVVFSKVKVFSYSPIIILTIFLYSFFISMWFESYSILRQQLMLVSSSLFLIYYIKFADVNMDNIAIISGFVLSLSTLLLIGSVVYEIIPIYNVFETYSSIGAGSRDVGNGVQDFFRLGGVPFLFISFSVLLKRIFEKIKPLYIVLLVFISFCIILSSTRSILVGCLLIVSFMFARKYIILSFYLPFIAFFYFLFNFDPSGGFFDTKDFGNAIKLKDAMSFIDWANIKNILFGEGLASLYYSGGRGYLVAQTENTFLDNIRYFGVILTLVFYLAILFPTLKCLSFRVEGGFYFSVMLIYILMSMTNPMLVNSFGFIVVLWYWSNVLNVEKEKCE